MKTILTAAILLFAVACGQPQGHQATSSPSTPPPQQPLLFAALQANGTPNAQTYNTVMVAGLDGRDLAKATFAPMRMPAVGCMGAVLPASAHVAAGKVFFADADGIVRSLAINGTVAIAATFPLTSAQQMLSFAVSPDGSRLLGTVYTVPTNAISCDGGPSGAFSFDAYSSTNGGSAKLVYHQTWTKPQSVLALTGWDSIGPFGTYPTVWASQGGGPASTLGVKVRVDATTIQPGANFSDPGQCLAWDSNQSGTFVCTKDGVVTNGGTAQQQVAVPVSVRQADGTEQWQFTAIGQNSPFGPYIAPDGQHVMICCNDLNLSDSHERLVGRDGGQSNLATGFFASGWLNSTTVIGWTNSDSSNPSSMAYVDLNSPDLVVSLRLTGAFVGTVRS